MFESSLFLWVIIFSTLGSIGAIGGASLLLLFPDSTRKRLLPCLLSYATGTLLGAAFLGMIPKAMEQAQTLNISVTILVGIVLFFLLEKILLWRHCHDKDCEVHSNTGPIILIGDAFHNFVDGLVIAAAFLTSIPMGIATSLAVIAHEIPQEVGDFAILLHSGYTKIRALVLNFLSSLSTLLGAVAAYLFSGRNLSTCTLYPGHVSGEFHLYSCCRSRTKPAYEYRIKSYGTSDFSDYGGYIHDSFFPLSLVLARVMH